MMRGHQWRHPAGHLTHGREQWQRIVTQPHRLVGNGDIVRRDERVSAFARSGEVQVREEHLILVRAESVILGRDRFLHLHQQIALGPDVVGRRPEGGAGAGLGLPVACGGRQRHAILVGLDLFWYADDHR